MAIKNARIHLKISEEDKIIIIQNAKNAGMTVSDFLRNLGVGHIPTSKIDNDLVLELSKINADQGRLGGLIKLWLSGDKRFRVGSEKIKHADLLVSILEKTKETQNRMLDLLKNFSS